MLQEGFLAEDDLGARDDYMREAEDNEEYRNARDLGDFARLHAASEAATQQNGHESSSSDQAGGLVPS